MLDYYSFSELVFVIPRLDRGMTVPGCRKLGLRTFLQVEKFKTGVKIKLNYFEELLCNTVLVILAY